MDTTLHGTHGVCSCTPLEEASLSAWDASFSGPNLAGSELSRTANGRHSSLCEPMFERKARVGVFTRLIRWWWLPRDTSAACRHQRAGWRLSTSCAYWLAVVPTLRASTKLKSILFYTGSVVPSCRAITQPRPLCSAGWRLSLHHLRLLARSTRPHPCTATAPPHLVLETK
jgi:hypothetical protein